MAQKGQKEKGNPKARCLLDRVSSAEKLTTVIDNAQTDTQHMAEKESLRRGSSSEERGRVPQKVFSIST